MQNIQLTCFSVKPDKTFYLLTIIVDKILYFASPTGCNWAFYDFSFNEKTELFSRRYT